MVQKISCHICQLGTGLNRPKVNPVQEYRDSESPERGVSEAPKNSQHNP